MRPGVRCSAGGNKLLGQADVDLFDLAIVSSIHACQMDDSVRLPDNLLKTARIPAPRSIDPDHRDLGARMEVNSQVPAEKPVGTGDGNGRHIGYLATPI